MILQPKAGVTSYQVNRTLTALETHALTPGKPMSAQVMMGGAAAPAQIIVPATSTPGLTLRIAAIDPANGPGSLRAAGAAPGMALQSAGMFYVDVVDAKGTVASPIDGMTIAIAPLTPPAVVGAEAYMAWQLNDAGEWASPTPAGDPAVGLNLSVTQFGFWNCDRSYRTACVKGTLATPTRACSGAGVAATGLYGIVSRDISAATGEFCVMGAQGWSSDIAVGAAGGVKVDMPSSAGDCSTPSSCANIGALAISDAACAGTSPVTMEPPATDDCSHWVCEDLGSDCVCRAGAAQPTMQTCAGWCCFTHFTTGYSSSFAYDECRCAQDQGTSPDSDCNFNNFGQAVKVDSNWVRVPACPATPAPPTGAVCGPPGN